MNQVCVCGHNQTMKLLHHPLTISSAIHLQNNIKLKRNRVLINCCINDHQDSNETLDSQLLNAKIIYSLAPAMGHNKDGHPECNARVPAIVTALDSMELTPKFHASDIVELQNFNPASVEDVASVHAKAYVSGLERAMEFCRFVTMPLFLFKLSLGEKIKLRHIYNDLT